MNNNNRDEKRKKLTQSVSRALRAAARQAKKTAQIYGTPIYIWQNGKVVAKKP